MCSIKKECFKKTINEKKKILIQFNYGNIGIKIIRLFIYLFQNDFTKIILL